MRKDTWRSGIRSAAISGKGMAGPVLAAIVLLSAVIFSMPDVVGELRTAFAIESLPYGQRREAVIGALYTSIRQLRRELPENETIALILRRPEDIGNGVFANYYLYPRTTRIYFGLDSYREDLSPDRFRTIVSVDSTSPTVLRRVSYEQLRSEQIAESPLTHHLPVADEPRSSFIVPFVGSVDGAPPDIYVIEAALLSPRDGSVRMRFEPEGKETTVLLRAGETTRFDDLLWDLFEADGVGWLRVESDVPFRSNWWLVNRGAGKWAPIEVVQQIPSGSYVLPPSDRIWLVNTSAHEAAATVNGKRVTLAPSEMTSLPGEETASVETDAGVLGFGSTKLPNRNTAFSWPEPRP
jgi:hypothetical protein